LLDFITVILLPPSLAGSTLSRDNMQSINSIKEYKILSRPTVLVYNKMATYFRMLFFEALPKFNSWSFLKWKQFLKGLLRVGNDSNSIILKPSADVILDIITNRMAG
jgi:hypothetical protein